MGSSLGNIFLVSTKLDTFLQRAAMLALQALRQFRLSVCPSVTRRYCVKTTARSTVQFALSDSKMCLETKNIPHGRPLPPEILAQSDLPHPDSSESWHVLPCSASTVRASNKGSIMTNRTSYKGFRTSHQPRFYAAPNFLKMGILLWVVCVCAENRLCLG